VVTPNADLTVGVESVVCAETVLAIAKLSNKANNKVIFFIIIKISELLN
jgi:hypothetical protein